MDEFIDNNTLEDLVLIFEGCDLYKTPIQKFEFNISKSRILYGTAQELKDIWPKIAGVIQKPDTHINYDIVYLPESLISFFKYGAASYFVYTEQALVSAVSAAEIYFRDKLESEFQKDKRILRIFGDRKIDLRRILDIWSDLNAICKLVIEKEDFQNIDDVQRLYKNVFGFEPLKDKEKRELDKIFIIGRYLGHRGGIVDYEFVQKFLDYKLLDFELYYKIGKRIWLERDQILLIINFIEKIIMELEKMIEHRNRKMLSNHENIQDLSTSFEIFDIETKSV